MKDEELQRAYQRSTTLTTMGRCPEPEQLADLVQGVGTEPDQLALLEHVLRCPTCRQELDLLRAANEGARAADTRRMSAPWMALAAAAVIAIGAGAVALRGTHSSVQPDVLRGPPHVVALIEPSAGESIVAPIRLAWHPVDGARSYRVELLTSRGDMIAARSTSDTILTVPASTQLRTGESYDVWVRAALADRTEMSSPVVRFTVK